MHTSPCRAFPCPFNTQSYQLGEPDRTHRTQESPAASNHQAQAQQRKNDTRTTDPDRPAAKKCKTNQINETRVRAREGSKQTFHTLKTIVDWMNILITYLKLKFDSSNILWKFEQTTFWSMFLFSKKIRSFGISCKLSPSETFGISCKLSCSWHFIQSVSYGKFVWNALVYFLGKNKKISWVCRLLYQPRER